MAMLILSVLILALHFDFVFVYLQSIILSPALFNLYGTPSQILLFPHSIIPPISVKNDFKITKEMVKKEIYGPGYDKSYPMAILIKIKLMMCLQSTTTKSIFRNFEAIIFKIDETKQL